MSACIGGLLPAGVVGQGGLKCFTPDGSTELQYLGYVQELATNTSPRFVEARANYGLSEVPLSEVEIVTDKTTCRDASQAFKSVVGGTGSSPQVWVIRVGTDFVVVDPTPVLTAGNRRAWITFDASFNVLGAFLS